LLSNAGGADALGPDRDATGHRSRQVHEQVDGGVGRHAPLAAQEQPVVAHRRSVQLGRRYASVADRSSSAAATRNGSTAQSPAPADSTARIATVFAVPSGAW